MKKLTKITISTLNIYMPSVLYGHQQLKNDDFPIETYTHFPILLNDDGSIWKEASLYLLYKIKSYVQPSPKTLDSIAIDLKEFREFCNSENINYLDAPRKIQRPTYLYREYLQMQLKNSHLSPNSVKRKISAVVGLYKYLIEVEGVKFRFPLWESGITSITYIDRHGFQQSKQVETKDVTKVISSPNENLYDEHIMDGGRLHPLSLNEQVALLNALKQLNNTEMTLGFLIALITGARMQTVFTLRLKHFKRIPSVEEKEIRIKIGYGTDCDTKFSKQHLLFFPRWFYEKIRIYSQSPRALLRRNRAKHIFDTEEMQYLFLNNRGTPFYCASTDPYRNQYKEAPNGGAVRQFICTSLKEALKIEKITLDFSFHDLRATFGMNLLDRWLGAASDDKEIDISFILMSIKERMGHSSLVTTEKYLKYRKKNKLKIQAQNDFESYMENFLWGN